MTIKISSLLPAFVVAATLSGDAAVYGDTGRLRGPLQQRIHYAKSADQARIIHPVHHQLKNSTVTPSDKLKRIRARVRKTKEEQNKSSHVLRGSTIDHSVANERKVVITPDDASKKNTAQTKYNQEEEKKNETSSSVKKNLATLENEIAEIRRRIQHSQEQLRAKLRQTIKVKDTAVEEEDESEFYFESDYDRDCVYSFHKEGDLDDFLKTNTNLHEHGHCRLHADIVQKSEIHARALIADGECRFDSTHGHWYSAKCVVGDDDENENEKDGRRKARNTRERLPNFVFTKAFCSHGCEECADPGELPGVNGRPDGPLFRTWGRPAYAVCELPAPGKEVKVKGRRKRKGKAANGVPDELYFVQYEGNCIQESCNDTFISTMSKVVY